MNKIPFNKPYLTNKEIIYIKDAHDRGQLAGDGYYTDKAQQMIEEKISAQKALLTHSCTGALEMMVLLSKINVGDEVIMPSFTFPSTANAVVLRGGVPVFVDIRKDTKNINEKNLEEAITPKTKAIFVVHYAGIGCEMDEIIKIAKRHKLLILEDAAQGFLSMYKGKYLGTIGDMGAFSFHETKNIISGEGGSIIINDKKYNKRAEIIREKGTNRSQFFRGEINKYSWVDMGSSYLPGEIIAAFLLAQLEYSHKINKKRIQIWNKYHKAMKIYEDKGFISRPYVPNDCKINGHLYYIQFTDILVRDKFISYLKKNGISAVFHYIPLHSSPAGKKYGRYLGDMRNTNVASTCLVRLPIYNEMSEVEFSKIFQAISNFFKNL